MMITFVECLLRNLTLIGLDENKWVLTAIVEGFFTSVSEPVITGFKFKEYYDKY
jgi:hypothetical protein